MVSWRDRKTLANQYDAHRAIVTLGKAGLYLKLVLTAAMPPGRVGSGERRLAESCSIASDARCLRDSAERPTAHVGAVRTLLLR